jgi:hypothetical protein
MKVSRNSAIRFCIAHRHLTFRELYERQFGPQNWYDEPYQAPELPADAEFFHMANVLAEMQEEKVEDVDVGFSPMRFDFLSDSTTETVAERGDLPSHKAG